MYFVSDIFHRGLDRVIRPKYSKVSILLFAAMCFLLIPRGSEASRIVCYFENWAQFRTSANNGPGIPPSCFPVSLTPIASKMTVLNYAFLTFNIDVSVPTPVVHNDWAIYNSEWNDTMLLAQAVALKNTNPGLKIFVSLGGWNFNDPNPADSRYGAITYQYFSQVCANSTGSNRQQLINSIISFLTANHLDGVDIDWEYPGQTTRGGNGSDYQNFITFLADLRAAFTTDGHGYQISLAVPPFLPSDTAVSAAPYGGGTYPANCGIYSNTPYSGGSVIANDLASYFIWYGVAAKFADWVNVMSYDMNGPWAPGTTKTGYNAPLFETNPTAPSVYNATLYWATSMYANMAPANVVVGIPAYGHTYSGVTFPGPLTGFPNSQYAAGCSYTGPGPQGAYTQQQGTLAYFEIYNDLYPTPTFFSTHAEDPNAVSGYAWSAPGVTAGNPAQASPYWVSYDNPVLTTNAVHSSVETKAQFILDNKLGGAMIYAISQDVYWEGAPILSTIYNVFQAGPTPGVNRPQTNSAAVPQ